MDSRKERVMPKIKRGRLSGVAGMQSHTSVELYALADQLRAQADDPKNTDDPKWLLRRAQKVAAIAKAKEKAFDQKQAQAGDSNGEEVT
jgi:hypothetical protein